MAAEVPSHGPSASTGFGELHSPRGGHERQAELSQSASPRPNDTATGIRVTSEQGPGEGRLLIGPLQGHTVSERPQQQDQATEQGQRSIQAPPSARAPWPRGDELDPKIRISFREITLHKIIGKGTFKTVYRGSWNNTAVAVVAMRRGGLVAEARLLQRLSIHPNLVQLYRWSADEAGNEYLVMELLQLGSLDAVLRSIGRQLLTQTKMTIVEQVVSACLELSQEGLVHGDLAARNLLVKSLEPPHVKLADFGLARLVSPSTSDGTAITASGSSAPAHGSQGSSATFASAGQQSQPQQQQPQRALGPYACIVPARWAAPEVLAGAPPSEAADVWSFAVTCWEVFANGAEPYTNLSNNQILPALQSGYRMDRPRGCPLELWELVTRCWSADPRDRPRFAEIAATLRGWREAYVSSRIAAAAAAKSGDDDQEVTADDTASPFKGPTEGKAGDSGGAEARGTGHEAATSAVGAAKQAARLAAAAGAGDAGPVSGGARREDGSAHAGASRPRTSLRRGASGPVSAGPGAGGVLATHLSFDVNDPPITPAYTSGSSIAAPSVPASREQQFALAVGAPSTGLTGARAGAGEAQPASSAGVSRLVNYTRRAGDGSLSRLSVYRSAGAAAANAGAQSSGGGTPSSGSGGAGLLDVHLERRRRLRRVATSLDVARPQNMAAGRQELRPLPEALSAHQRGPGAQAAPASLPPLDQAAVVLNLQPTAIVGSLTSTRTPSTVLGASFFNESTGVPSIGIPSHDGGDGERGAESGSVRATLAALANAIRDRQSGRGGSGSESTDAHSAPLPMVAATGSRAPNASAAAGQSTLTPHLGQQLLARAHSPYVRISELAPPPPIAYGVMPTRVAESAPSWSPGLAMRAPSGPGGTAHDASPFPSAAAPPHIDDLSLRVMLRMPATGSRALISVSAAVAAAAQPENTGESSVSTGSRPSLLGLPPGMFALPSATSAIESDRGSGAAPSRNISASEAAAVATAAVAAIAAPAGPQPRNPATQAGPSAATVPVGEEQIDELAGMEGKPELEPTLASLSADPLPLASAADAVMAAALPDATAASEEAAAAIPQAQPLEGLEPTPQADLPPALALASDGKVTGKLTEAPQGSRSWAGDTNTSQGRNERRSIAAADGAATAPGAATGAPFLVQSSQDSLQRDGQQQAQALTHAQVQQAQQRLPSALGTPRRQRRGSNGSRASGSLRCDPLRSSQQGSPAGSITSSRGGAGSGVPSRLMLTSQSLPPGSPHSGQVMSPADSLRSAGTNPMSLHSTWSAHSGGVAAGRGGSGSGGRAVGAPGGNAPTGRADASTMTPASWARGGCGSGSGGSAASGRSAPARGAPGQASSGESGNTNTGNTRTSVSHGLVSLPDSNIEARPRSTYDELRTSNGLTAELSGGPVRSMLDTGTGPMGRSSSTAGDLSFSTTGAPGFADVSSHAAATLHPTGRAPHLQAAGSFGTSAAAAATAASNLMDVLRELPDRRSAEILPLPRAGAPRSSGATANPPMVPKRTLLVTRGFEDYAAVAAALQTPAASADASGSIAPPSGRGSGGTPLQLESVWTARGSGVTSRAGDVPAPRTQASAPWPSSAEGTAAAAAPSLLFESTQDEIVAERQAIYDYLQTRHLRDLQEGCDW